MSSWAPVDVFIANWKWPFFQQKMGPKLPLRPRILADEGINLKIWMRPYNHISNIMYFEKHLLTTFCQVGHPYFHTMNPTLLFATFPLLRSWTLTTGVLYTIFTKLQHTSICDKLKCFSSYLSSYASFFRKFRSITVKGTNCLFSTMYFKCFS